MKSRQDAIRAVLKEAEKPIGPTEIARRVNDCWCYSGGMPGRGYPQSAPVCAELKRMGDVSRVGRGLYYLRAREELRPSVRSRVLRMGEKDRGL